MASTDVADNEADLDDEKSGKPKKKLPIKLLIIGVVALLAIGGGGFAAWKMLKGKGHDEAKPAAPVAKPVVFIDMPDVLVNLSNSNSERPQYLKVKIVLEVADQALSDKVKPLMPRVTDLFQTYLRELRPNDLDGSVGLFRLREELTRRVNAVLAPNRVNAVLFKEIIIQ
jgi:flagellar FliL protein